MKIAVTASGPDTSSAIDQRFGRAAYLLVVDTVDGNVATVDNKAGMDASQGAGIQAAQKVIDNGADVLVSGHCGPKAFRALSAAGVKVYLAPEGTVDQAVDAFQQGGLEEALAADVDGHW